MNPVSGSKVSLCKDEILKHFSFRQEINGSLKGDIMKIFQASVGGFKSQLNSLASDSCDESKIEVQYSATGCPDKSPTTVAQLLKLIEDFPATLQNINEGKGVPMEVATCLFLSFFAFCSFFQNNWRFFSRTFTFFLYFALRAFFLSICQGVTNKTYDNYNNLFILSFKDHY